MYSDSSGLLGSERMPELLLDRSSPHSRATSDGTGSATPLVLKLLATIVAKAYGDIHRLTKITLLYAVSVPPGVLHAKPWGGSTWANGWAGRISGRDEPRSTCHRRRLQSPYGGAYMITRIIIRGYKSLNNFRVDLGPIAVIVGPNASGKSNVLDALQLLASFVTSGTLTRAFETSHRGKILESCSYGSEGLEGLRKKPDARLRFEVDVKLSDTVVENVKARCEALRKPHDETTTDENTSKNRGWIYERHLRYVLEVRVDTKTAGLSVVDESLTPLRSDLKPKSRKPFISKEGNKLHLRMEGQAHPRYLDIGLDHTVASTELYAPHYPHVVAFREELSRWRFYYFEPKRLMRAETPIADVKYVDSSGGRLAAFYHALAANNPRQFNAVVTALRSFIPQIQEIGTEVDKVGNVELTVLENGVPYSGRLISEGTLRMLGIFAAVNAPEPPTLIGYEEPENGIHPERISLVADLFKNQAELRGFQLIVNTHSPWFPDCFKESELFRCQRVGGRTDWTRLSELGPLFKESAIMHSLADFSVPETP